MVIQALLVQRLQQTTAVNYVLNQALAAYSLVASRYTADGATTANAGLVKLVIQWGQVP